MASPASPPADATRGAEAAAPARDPNSPEAQSAEMLNAIVGQIFSTRRPRDVCAGAASAVKSVGKALALGVAVLIAAPAAAAYNQNNEDDPPPRQPQQSTMARLGTVAAGVGAGIAGAVLLPLAGAIVGLVQVVRGAWNTPSAVYHCVTGDQVWDSDDGVWRDRQRCLDQTYCCVGGVPYCHIVGESERTYVDGHATNGFRAPDTNFVSFFRADARYGSVRATCAVKC